jgi:hypothetical protein
MKRLKNLKYLVLIKNNRNEKSMNDFEIFIDQGEKKQILVDPIGFRDPLFPTPAFKFYSVDHFNLLLHEILV